MSTDKKSNSKQADQEFEIAYLPFDGTENSYTQRMKEVFGHIGQVVAFRGTIPTLKLMAQRRVKRYDAIVINWEENNIIDPRTRRATTGRALRLFFKTALMRLCTRRLLFVRHNNYPHQTGPGEEQAARRWIDLYEKIFHACLTHSPIEENRSRIYCPHPLYHVDEPATADQEPSFELPARYSVVFGRILRYKKIKEIIENTPTDINLLVCGSIGDQEYANELQTIKRKNLLFVPGMISDATAAKIVKGAESVILGHAEKNVVVSGTFFFSMSCGTPVIAVATPFLKWAEKTLGAEHIKTINDISELSHTLSTRSLKDRARAVNQQFSLVFGEENILSSLKIAIDPGGRKAIKN